MFKLDVQADVRKVQRQLEQLARSVQDRAIAAALNKTADKAKAEMRRQITSEFAIKASEVGSQIRVTRASAKGGMLIAVIEAFPRRRGHASRNVALFRARQTRNGVTVQIKRSGGRKLIPGAFIGNGGRTVFERVSGTTMSSRSKSKGPLHRQQIKAVETIDVPQMFNTRRINAKVIAKIGRDLPVELERAIRAAIAKTWR